MTHAVIEFCKSLDDPPQTLMIRPQLDLPGGIENDISCGPSTLLPLTRPHKDPIQPFHQPIKVRLEIFHTIEDRAVRSQTVLIHHLVEGDEVGDAQRAGVGRVGDGGVEVDDVDRTAEGCKKLCVRKQDYYCWSDHSDLERIRGKDGSRKLTWCIPWQ